MALVIEKYLGDRGYGGHGDAVAAQPDNQCTRLDATMNIGGCSGLYYSLVFQLGKWGFTMKKVDEAMDVSPIYAEAYNLTVEQKHKLEGQIKQGLASAAQAVADYELIRHDVRKYKEILDFWEKGKKDDHILRSMFIDKVDATVGENFAIISMVKRWPTLIADFIRFSKLVKKEDEEDVEKIRKALKVTVAEATVLKSKNMLYNKWKESFFPEVRDRYARIKNLMKARESSMNEYREWMKPYVARYKVMAESLQGSQSGIASSVFMAPGFGNSLAESSVRFFAWKAFYVPEMGKPQRQKTFKPERDAFVLENALNIVKQYKLNLSEELKEQFKKAKMGEDEIKRRLGSLKTDEDKVKVWMKSLWDGILKADSIDTTRGEMKASAQYYIVMDITTNKAIAKLPKGGELEDMVFTIRNYMMSDNLVFLLWLEIYAKGKEFERYVDEIIGTKKTEDAIREEMKADYPSLLGEDVEAEKGVVGDLKTFYGKFKAAKKRVSGWVKPYKKYFIREGPYQGFTFRERMPKMFLIPSGQQFGKVVRFLKWKMGVPGMPEEY